MHVDLREDLGLRLRPLGGHVAGDILHRLAALLEDVDDVVGGASAGADEEKLNRARPRFRTALVGVAKDDAEARLDLAREAPRRGPFDTRIRRLPLPPSPVPLHALPPPEP